MPAHRKIRPRPLAWLAAAVACAPLTLSIFPLPSSAQPVKAAAPGGTAGSTAALGGTTAATVAGANAAPVAGPAAPADFTDCLSRLRPAAVAKGVTGTVFDNQTAALAPDMSILPLLDAQPEFVTPIWDYLAALVDDERVADGREMLERWRKVLAQVEDQYGVDPATVVAVWGVESNFGRNFGKRPLLASLSTLSCYGRRQAYFQGEFFTTLKIIEDGDIAPERLNGSWAGAFGHTQFMPSTFMRLAVDFDGDGRRDLIDSVPDALASTANFLRKAGWRSDEPWGFEVKLPAGFDASDAGRRNKRPLSAWAARGLKRVDGTALTDGSPRGSASATAASGSAGAAGGSVAATMPLDGGMPAGLLLPAGPKGPAFLVMRNFDAIYSYNAAESYALAIAHLSDRLRGGSGLATPWPTDDPGLSRAERRELQSLLIARGHDIGEIDGMLGGRTREALKAAQADLGLEADGRAGQKALAALRAAAAKAR